MNIFGFLAVLIVCITILILAFLAIKYPVQKHIHQYIHTVNDNPQPTETPVPEDINPGPTEIKQMDAVIAAVNNLMGIPMEDTTDDAR